MTTTLPLANSLHRATLDALRRLAPFATMNKDEVLWLIQHLSVAYFERDAPLLEPADAPPDTLFIYIPTVDTSRVYNLGELEVSASGTSSASSSHVQRVGLAQAGNSTKSNPGDPHGGSHLGPFPMRHESRVHHGKQ